MRSRLTHRIERFSDRQTSNGQLSAFSNCHLFERERKGERKSCCSADIGMVPGGGAVPSLTTVRYMHMHNMYIVYSGESSSSENVEKCCILNASIHCRLFLFSLLLLLKTLKLAKTIRLRLAHNWIVNLSGWRLLYCLISCLSFHLLSTILKIRKILFVILGHVSFERARVYYNSVCLFPFSVRVWAIFSAQCDLL